MKLATLGSDKSVTTINSIMTEILTDIKPSEIYVYRETAPKKPLHGLKDVLKMLGISVEIHEKIIGEGVTTWKEKISKEDIDVFDITPGRKYMALASANYSHAREVRYVYLKDESQGYRIFGYAPFEKLKVFRMNDGKEIKINPPPYTLDSLNREAMLDAESLTALYNTLKLHGEVKLRIGFDYVEDLDDEFIKTCKIRSGMLRFKEEEEISKYLKPDSGCVFIADTNVYINLGNRIGKLFYEKSKGFMLFPSVSVYKELKYKLEGTQKGDQKLVLFRLGMNAYNNIHKSFIPEVKKNIEEKNKNNNMGDVALKVEAENLKRNLPYNVIIITGDKGLALSSHSVKTLLLKELSPSKDYDMGEFLYCLSFSEYYYEGKRLRIEVNGKEVAEIVNDNDYKVKVKTLDPKYNYAKVLESLMELSRG